jgi:hypothetical protein
VLITTGQITAVTRHKNRFDKTIDYELTIQRSTGRFAERYTEENAQTPF